MKSKELAKALQIKKDQNNTIAIWMGWHKKETTSFLYVNPNVPIFWDWVDDLEIIRANQDFDPHINVNDCTRVMEEVISRGAWWSLHSPTEKIRFCCFMGGKDMVDQAEGDSWPEAFCNVLIKLIEQRKQVKATKEMV